METSVSLTLTRAHKVAERLESEIKSIENQLTVLSGVPMQVWNLKNSAEELRNSKRRALEALDKLTLISDSIRTIRSELGRANVETGVSDRLASQEHDRRIITAMKRFLGENTSNQLALHKIDQSELPTAGDGVLQSRTATVTVNLLDEAERAQLAASLEGRRRSAHALSDELADLNQKKITITLDAEVWRMAGIETGH